MANFQNCSFLPTRVLTYVRFLVSVLCIAFLCGSSLWADYNAATADLGAAWTVTSSNGVTLDGSVLNYAKHTGTLTISSDPNFTLTNGAVFEQSGNITSGNHKAIVAKGGGTLKLTCAGSLNSQNNGLWGFYFYDGSVIDTTGAGFMCLYGSSSNLRFYGDGELIIGTNVWTKTTTELVVYSGANAKISQSTASGISDASGLNLSTAGSVTFNVEENATLTSTVRIYDEGSTGGITKTGAGTMTILNSNNEYNKGTTISAGKLVLSGAGNLTATSGVSIASGATLEFKDNDSNGEGGAVTFSRTISGAGNLVKSGTGTVTLSGSNTFIGNITISGGTLNVTKSASLGANSSSRTIAIGNGAELVIAVDNLIANAHYDQSVNYVLDGGRISNSGQVYNYIQNLTLKNGSSVYAADGASVWKAYKFHNINVERNADDSAGLPVEISASNNEYATIAFGAKSDTIKAGTSVSTINVAEITSVDASVNDNVSDFKISAVIKDSLYQTSGALTNSTEIVKTGAGTLEFSAANLHTGKTTISEGTVKLTGAGTLGSGAVENNGTLEFAHDSTQTISNAISGLGSVVKSGAGKLTLSGSNSYSGETTISGGTLLVPSTASLATSQVTVTEGGKFQTGATLVGIPVNLDCGTFVIGDTSASKELMIGALTLTGGTICFDFNDCTVLDDGYNVDTDWLKVSSASLSSGVIDLSFHGSSAEDWWNVIKNNYSESGFEIITGQISDSERFNSNNVTVSVNGTPSDSWTLTAKSGGLYLFATEDQPGPEPGNVWYDANTSDIDLLDWTIDGTNKVGAKFTEGSDSETFSGSVALTGAGEFQIGAGQNLTLSEEVTGDGALTKTGEGTLTLSQAPGYTGSTAVETGTLVLSAGGTLNNLSGAGTVDNSGKALTLNNTSNSEFSGVIKGAGAVAKTGSGTLELSGENAYTGATTVSAGELVFSGSVLPVSAMTATGGALVFGTEGETITIKRNSSVNANGGAVRVDGNLVFEAPGSGFVACDGSWTGSGSMTLDGGYIRVGTNFNTTTGINFNGGSILNNNNDGILTSDLTITKDGSTMQAGWSKSLTLKGALKGNASLTVGSDSGWLIFSGNGSAYQGSLLVKGQMRVGVANTDSSDVSQYIGGKVINLNGGTIQNNNNNITFTNDLNVMTETGFKAGWSKSITLTGNVTGSAKLKLVSDSGWLILKTHSDNDAFTGPFQTGWASTSSRGQTRLAAEQPLGANCGVLYNYGYLDMNGYSQKFKGVVDDGSNNKLGRIYNTTGTKSVVTFDITSQNLSYAGTIESNVELIVNASGAGTQTFTNGGSSFTGNATINGGTIRMTGKGTSGNSPIGKVSDTRSVYVNNGGELVFANQDVLANAHNYAPINFVVDGGKISNEGAYYNFLQNTTFKNGGQLYASDGNATWKAFKLLNVTVARNDDDAAGAPVLFSADPSKPDATIAFGDISSVIKEGNSVSTVNVAEITSANASVNDNVSDLVISAVITDPTYQTDGALKHATQIIKTGAGTMELTAANTITGKTTISEGTIKLSGSGTLGSGEVENNATLEFAHESDQTFSNAISGTGAVVKSGSGTLTISNNNYSYTGETTVSGGTLLVTSAGSLSTSKVTVASATGATFQTGANLNGIDFELGQGGTFIIGESSASKEITIGALTLSGGTISFDFNDIASESADWLKVSSASMNSGVINLTFNSSSEEDWANVISTSYADGFPIISGTITNYESFNPNSVRVAVNGTVSSDWKLTAANNAILLMTSNDEPVPSEPWYFANTSDISLQNWTIDGTEKLGAKFTEGDDAATFTGGVALSANGEFEISDGKNLTISGVISGEGGLEKTGAGTLTLSGDNTYTGETKVSEGTLQLTKVGKKGTLATGSTVTVDGATSKVVGHGDIFGYTDETVGTINLTNGGTLHNDSTDGHITIGAAINMNNGVISAEDGWGDGFGNYVFDNAINVLGGTDNAITANKITLRQAPGTPGNAGGKFTVADGAKLTISSQIADADGDTVPLVKLGEGTLVLSGDNTYSHGTTVSAGTLQLTKVGKKGTLATGSEVTVDGATSKVVGHGDIFGYTDETVGTINLTNGGTLHNDSTDSHITVGAAINMNNGVISAENGSGSDTYGNYVFDNAVNVLGGTDNAITATRISLRQAPGTPGNAGGKFTVADGAKLTISSQIDNADGDTVPLVKLGAGTLVLSGDSTHTYGTFVNEGTLQLTKTGKKGTLATGSTVTVDGATSKVVGHGDIFGYTDETVGTINLTNGGTLHNDSTGDHITMGAVVNMNNGVISAENGSGSDTFGNYVFDNAVNVLGGTDNAIAANKITLRNLGAAGAGQFNVADGAKLTISSQIADPDGSFVSLVKQGAGTLVLSGDNTYTKGANVNEGTLQLTGDAVKANSSIAIAENATLEYNVASGEKSLDFTTSNTTVSGNGNVAKTGAGKLKIKADGEQFSVSNFTVEAGELDFKGQYNGDLAVQRGATLSPGNSVGDLTVYGNVTIDAGATGLFEFSAYNENQFDTLTIANADNAFLVDTNSIIKLYFEGNDADLWAADGAEYKLVSDEGFVSATTDLSSLLGNFTNLFGLEGRTDGLYLVALNGPIPPEPGSGVPEPSTWALLALGVVVLLLRKRVRN